METANVPTTDKWIKKMWYLYIMELYSATKKNEILSFAGKWMELGNYFRCFPPFLLGYICCAGGIHCDNFE
jgi:hypothetical protein